MLRICVVQPNTCGVLCKGLGLDRTARGGPIDAITSGNSASAGSRRAPVRHDILGD